MAIHEANIIPIVEKAYKISRKWSIRENVDVKECVKLLDPAFNPARINLNYADLELGVKII